MNRPTVQRFGNGFLVFTQKTITQDHEVVESVEVTRTTTKDGKRQLKNPVVEVQQVTKMVSMKMSVPHNILVMRRSSLKRRGLKVPRR